MVEEKSVHPEYMALCPLDGRYHKIGKELSVYFSEYALAKNRVKVEVYWLKYLLENIKGCKILDEFDHSNIPQIIAIYENFSIADFAKVKEFEKVTNHDVKSVELFVAEKLKELGLYKVASFVHIGCTSEDINNTAYATMISEALSTTIIPHAESLIKAIYAIAEEHKNTAMLAHTHGQPATPTTVGKEFTVYGYRLRNVLDELKKLKSYAKFNGATGNYSAISIAFPGEDWPLHSKQFVEEYLGLTFNPITTQIESHDYICSLADILRHFNNVLLDFDLDMWLYISMEYFKQITVASEVGSSTMPHKVNPIRFENSESNIDMANAILTALSNKLARSRLQRDLSDSSTMRNIGMAFGYSLQAIQQTIGGLKKVAVNTEKLKFVLENNWEVLAEPIQTMLRKYGIQDAYDLLKTFTRGKRISKEAIQEFISVLDKVSEDDKATLLMLTPSTYVGLATQIVESELSNI